MSEMRIVTEKKLNKIQGSITDIVFYSFSWEEKEIIKTLKEQINVIEQNITSN